MSNQEQNLKTYHQSLKTNHQGALAEHFLWEDDLILPPEVLPWFSNYCTLAVKEKKKEKKKKWTVRFIQSIPALWSGHLLLFYKAVGGSRDSPGFCFTMMGNQNQTSVVSVGVVSMSRWGARQLRKVTLPTPPFKFLQAVWGAVG